MIWFLLGVALLVVLLASAREFSRADVATIRSLLAWIAALGGISLAVLLLLTGRGPAALSALILFGPLAWSWWKQDRRAARPQAGRRPGDRMSREEAYAVLGLSPGATEADIRAAWLRLMQAAHPDKGGSDWLAARINQARDVLLRGNATSRGRER
jgi:hypothetical protein